MKPVRIEHERCGEWDDLTWVWAPDDWNEERIQSAVDAAQRDYLAALQAWKDGGETAPNKATQFSQPDYSAHPARTVAEVQMIHAAEKKAYREWEEARRRARQPFRQFLHAHGFVLLGDDGFGEIKVELNWGHRHGLPLDYGPDINAGDVRATVPDEKVRVLRAVTAGTVPPKQEDV